MRHTRDKRRRNELSVSFEPFFLCACTTNQSTTSGEEEELNAKSPFVRRGIKRGGGGSKAAIPKCAVYTRDEAGKTVTQIIVSRGRRGEAKGRGQSAPPRPWGGEGGRTTPTCPFLPPNVASCFVESNGKEGGVGGEKAFKTSPWREERRSSRGRKNPLACERSGEGAIKPGRVQAAKSPLCGGRGRFFPLVFFSF